MKRCDRCQIDPDLIEQYCKVVNGRQHCYKDGPCARCAVPEKVQKRYCRAGVFNGFYYSVCFTKNVKPHIDAAKAVLSGYRIEAAGKDKFKVYDSGGNVLSEPPEEKAKTWF